MKQLTFLVFFLQFFIAKPAIGQKPELDVEKWAKRLADPNDKMNQWFDSLEVACKPLDSVSSFRFLDQLGRDANANNAYFKTRLLCLHAAFRVSKHPVKEYFDPAMKLLIKPDTDREMAQAMRYAYELNDDYLTLFVSGLYGGLMSALDQTESAVMYLTNSVDLCGKLHVKPKLSACWGLGELLWKVKEYEKSIKYTQLALNQLEAYNEQNRYTYTMFLSNTMALAYHRLERYDSAFVYYDQAYKAAEKLNLPGWMGIVSGNRAQIYFAQGNYRLAKELFTFDYKASKENGYYDNLTNTLQWLARTNLALGNKAEARQQIAEAFSLLQKWPNANSLRNSYFTAAEIFKSMGENDSTYYYSKRYNYLNDSLEKVIYQSSMDIARLRINDERNKYNILNLQREKKSQLQLRNFAIILIALLAAFALLLLNRQRLKMNYRLKIEQQEKLRTEAEMQSARMQLQMFTGNLVEKANLVERLEQQLRSQATTSQDQRAITELSNQTILSDDDWDNFKLLFEKTFPLFFVRLKEMAPDITQAEQRLAALIRLQLTTRQMAAVLGISPDSVHKTRQRLRKRFNLSADANLEEKVLAV